MNEKAHELLFPKFSLYQSKKEHPNWKQLQIEAAHLALNIAKNMSTERKLFQGILFQKRKLLAIVKTFKNLLKNKIKMANGDHNFSPLFYIWTMTNNCNFKCSYCSDHRGGVYPDLFNKGFNKNLSTTQGMKLLKIMKEASAIYFCGGEPTTRKDLPELLAYTTKLNMFNMINTNGSLIGDLLLKPRYRNFLRQMDVIIVSLDGLNISELAKMYQSTESIARKVIRNILALRILQNFARFKLVVNDVITHTNIEDSVDVLNWSNDLKISYSPVSANIDNQPDWELLKNKEYLELADKILDRARQGYPMIASPRMLERLLKFKGFMCYPKTFYHIDYTGEVFWPCKAYKKAIKINILKYKNVKQVSKAGKSAIDASFFHGKGKEKCGGECAWMQDCVCDTYGMALREGIFDSGVLKEIRGLLR